MRTFLLALACAAAVLAAGPAPASASGDDRLYSVSITGIHVVDWQYASLDHPDKCKYWSQGSGQQKVGFTTRRAMRFKGYFRRTAGPDGEAPFMFYPDTQGTWKASVTRSGTWEDHQPPPADCTPCGPLSEYGPCEEDPNLLAPLHNCGTKPLPKTSANAGYGQRGLEVQIRVSVDELFTNCPPTVKGNGGAEIQQPYPLVVGIDRPQAERLPGLKRGATLTLKGAAEQGYALPKGIHPGDCDKAKADRGYRECATTDVTLRIRRTR